MKGSAVITIESDGKQVRAAVEFNPPLIHGEQMEIKAHKLAAQAMYELAAKLEGIQDHVVALH